MRRGAAGLATVIALGCAGKPPTHVEQRPAVEQRPSSASPLLMREIREPPSSFDTAEASRTVRAAKVRLKLCRQDGGTVHARAILTFDASGAVLEAHLDDDALAATDAGRCALSTLRTIRLRNLRTQLTIATTFTLE